MSITRIAHFPGGTEEHHRAVVEALGDAFENAPGRLVFAAGPASDGWEIVQVWQSREAMDRWVEAALGPAFGRIGDRGYPNPPQITDVELTDLLLDAAPASR